MKSVAGSKPKISTGDDDKPDSRLFENYKEKNQSYEINNPLEKIDEIVYTNLPVSDKDIEIGDVD